ncbi:hypothetical protein, partial [Siminovitchia fortis]|uniref:hypothetical protein n=1 Tax=Siminovitchia fortis TaxID=254758 RepID=UPI001C92F0B6
LKNQSEGIDERIWHQVIDECSPIMIMKGKGKCWMGSFGKGLLDMIVGFVNREVGLGGWTMRAGGVTQSLGSMV